MSASDDAAESVLLVSRQALRLGLGFADRLGKAGRAGRVFRLLAAGMVLFPPSKELSRFLAYTVVISILLIAVVWLTGEPPRWRWSRERTGSS